MEMLITNDKFANEWKTMKTKFMNNTKIASSSSVSPKNPSSVNSQNRFDNLIVNDVSQIKIHGLQDRIPTNHHKRCETTNTKSKSRAQKIIHTGFVHPKQ